MTVRTKNMVHFTIAIIGVFVIIFGIHMLNQYFIQNVTLAIRAVLLIMTQWLLLMVPVILMIINRDTLKDIGFTKDKVLLQVLTGILIAAVMSLVLTVIPILFGFKDMIGSTSYTKAWQFTYEFVYTTLGVAFAEEFVFRGYLFSKLLKIKNTKLFAIIVSSVIFGLFHYMSGNIIQIIMTTFIGIILCLFREKIRNCTLLSLIIAHGFYDALITLWVKVLQ